MYAPTPDKCTTSVTYHSTYLDYFSACLTENFLPYTNEVNTTIVDMNKRP